MKHRWSPDEPRRPARLQSLSGLLDSVDDLEVRRVIEMFGGTAYKTYRVFAQETKSPAP